MIFYIIPQSVASHYAKKYGIHNVFITHKHFDMPKYTIATWTPHNSFDDAENELFASIKRTINDFVKHNHSLTSATDQYMYQIGRNDTIIQTTHSDDLFASSDPIEYIKIIKCFQTDQSKLDIIYDKIKLLL